MNNYKLIESNSLQLEYFSEGHGSLALLCFHGFGRSAQDFRHLSGDINCKLIALNLPLHGNSVVQKNNGIIEKQELLNAIKQLLIKEKVQSFYLLGYSLGGKVALSIAECSRLPLLGVLLFAPDGFKSNPWYWFASQTIIGERLNKQSINNPWVFLSFLKLSKRLKLASKRQVSFAQSQMSTIEKRKNVFGIWRSHKLLQPDLIKVSGTLADLGVELKIILGEYDKIIPLKPIECWVKKQNNASLEVLKNGHVFSDETIREKVIKFLEA